MKKMNLLLIISLLLSACSVKDDNDISTDNIDPKYDLIEELRNKQDEIFTVYHDELQQQNVYVVEAWVDEIKSKLHIGIFDLDSNKAEVIYKYVDKNIVVLENSYRSVTKTVLNMSDGRILVFGNENSTDMCWYSYDKDKLKELDIEPGDVVKVISTGITLTSFPGQAHAMEILNTEEKVESKSIIGKLISTSPGRLLVDDEFVSFSFFDKIDPDLIGDIVEMDYIEHQINEEKLMYSYKFTTIEEKNAYQGYVQSLDGNEVLFYNLEQDITFNKGEFSTKDFQLYHIMYIEYEEIDGVKTITKIISPELD